MENMTPPKMTPTGLLLPHSDDHIYDDSDFDFDLLKEDTFSKDNSSDLLSFADQFMKEQQLQPSSSDFQGVEFAPQASATQQQYAGQSSSSLITSQQQLQPSSGFQGVEFALQASATQQQYAGQSSSSLMISQQQQQQQQQHDFQFLSKGKEPADGVTPSSDGSKKKMPSKALSSTTLANVPATATATATGSHLVATATGSHLEEQLQPSSDFQGIDFTPKASATHQQQYTGQSSHQQQYTVQSSHQQQYTGQSSTSLMTSQQQQQQQHFQFQSQGKESADGVTPSSDGSKKKMPSKALSSTTQANNKRQRVPKKAELVAACKDHAREKAHLENQLEVARGELAARLKDYQVLRAASGTWDSTEKKKVAEVLSKFKDENVSLRRTIGMLQQQLTVHKFKAHNLKEQVSTLTEKHVNTVKRVIADTLVYKGHVDQLLSEFCQP